MKLKEGYVLLPRNELHPLQQRARHLAVDVLPHRRAVRRRLGWHHEACAAAARRGGRCRGRRR